MNKSSSKNLVAKKNSHEDDFNALCDALLHLKSRDECKRFLLDLCTPAEIEAFEERWLLARILDKTVLSYRDVHAKTGISVTTVGRVSRFLTQEPHQGYRLVLDKMKKHKS